MKEIRQLCMQCSTCSTIKPRFYGPQYNLIRSKTQYYERGGAYYHSLNGQRAAVL